MSLLTCLTLVFQKCIGFKSPVAVVARLVMLRLVLVLLVGVKVAIIFMDSITADQHQRNEVTEKPLETKSSFSTNESEIVIWTTFNNICVRRYKFKMEEGVEHPDMTFINHLFTLCV